MIYYLRYTNDWVCIDTSKAVPEYESANVCMQMPFTSRLPATRISTARQQYVVSQLEDSQDG